MLEFELVKGVVEINWPVLTLVCRSSHPHSKVTTSLKEVRECLHSLILHLQILRFGLLCLQMLLRGQSGTSNLTPAFWHLLFGTHPTRWQDLVVTAELLAMHKAVFPTGAGLLGELSAESDGDLASYPEQGYAGTLQAYNSLFGCLSGFTRADIPGLIQ